MSLTVQELLSVVPNNPLMVERDSVRHPDWNAWLEDFATQRSERFLAILTTETAGSGGPNHAMERAQLTGAAGK